MPAYVVVDIEVLDPGPYEEYKKLTPASIAAYGGRYLARGGQTEILDGQWSPKRLVILEFENADRARQWYHSPEYTAAKKVRGDSAIVNMVIIEGM